MSKALKEKIKQIFKDHVTWHDVIHLDQFNKWIEETEKQVLALLGDYAIIEKEKLRKILAEKKPFIGKVLRNEFIKELLGEKK